MTNVPGTTVRAVFQPVTGSYPPLYYGAREKGPVLASMNAGNSPSLFVGGGGINAGFARVLAPQDTGAYTKLHQALADGTEAGKFGTADYSDSPDPMMASTVCNQRLAGATDYTGIAFTDVFTDDLCPHSNTANRGMLYVAPPQGSQYSDDQSFLDAVQTVGTHSVQAIAAHNKWAGKNDAPQIEAIRLCMYSSGIYRRSGVTTDQVACAIFDGVQQGLQADAGGLSEVQMPVASGHDTYFKIIQDNLGG